MPMLWNMTKEERIANEERRLVDATTDAEDLVKFVVERDKFSLNTRRIAGRKLLEMYKEGLRGGVSLFHVQYVADYADEPFKSKASKIIREAKI